MADSKFSSELIYNFNALCARNDIGFNVVKDFGEFLKKRAEIEADYAKKLNQHYKTVPGSGMFTKEAPFTKETKSLKDALQSVSDKGLQVSDSHLEVSTKITSELCKTIDSWIKTKESDRKKIISEGQKHLKTIADAKSNVAKNKVNYEKLMKESDLAKDALIKAEKDEINQPDNKKLQQVTRKCSENFNSAQSKAKTAETTYKTSVEKTNEDLASFKDEKMPAVLEQLQQLEQDRWNSLLSIVKSYKQIQESLPLSYTKQISEIENVIELANVDNDMKEIISTCKKEKDEEKVEFVPYKSKHEDSTSTSSTTTGTSSSSSTSSTSTVTAEKVEEKPKDGSTFGTQTAEQQLESQKKDATKQPTETKEQAEEKKKKEEENKQKANQAKATLFGDLDDKEDIFK